MKLESKYAIAINNLNWNYDKKKVLNNINIEFERRKFYSIIGPNGSGKTTILKNITRILEPVKNTVFINDQDLNSLKNNDLAKILSYVPQETSIDFEFTVFDIVLMGRNPYKKRFEPENEEDINIAKTAMNLTNTWDLREAYIDKISGGEWQRVLIARAIAQEAKILLLDEPISHLDIHHQIEILENLKNLIKTKAITVITTLHDLNLASFFSDYLILINNGKIVSYGSPKQVITKENINKVYNLNVHIIENPVNYKPHIIPMSLSPKLICD